MLFENKWKKRYMTIKNYIEVMVEYNKNHAEKLCGDDSPTATRLMDDYISQKIALSDILVKMKKIERES